MRFLKLKSRFACKVSAVIPCRNAAAYLPACLDSLLEQAPGYCPAEILVVDDGSTDDTARVVSKYRRRDRRIKQWRVEVQNANRARLFGVSMSKGSYILLLDADNWLEPDFVRLMFQGIETPDKDNKLPAFAYGDRIIHYESDWHPCRDAADNDIERVSPGPFDPERLKRNNYIDMCSLIRREAVVLDPSLHYFQDWDLWLRLAEQNQYGRYIKDAVFHYRVHENNMTRERLQKDDESSAAKIIRRYGLHSSVKCQRKESDLLLASVVVIARSQEEVDKTIQILKKQTYPKKEFCTSTAPGFAAAYQEAMDKVSGDIVVFTETDCVPLNENWLADLVASVKPDTIVHGLTITDTTPNMSNLALPAAVAKKFPRNTDYAAAEDTEWILRMQAAGIKYEQLSGPVVYHLRPFVRTSLVERAYQYGRDWVRLSRKYGYIDVKDLELRASTERDVAIQTLKGIQDQISVDSRSSQSCRT